MTQNHIAFFQSVVGSTYVLTSASDLESYGRDWTKVYKPDPMAIVLPASTDQVSKIARYCSENQLSLVPSGGRTGLAGGSVATNKEVVISLNRMSKIEKIDCIGMTVACEAGVTLQQLQEAAADNDVYFALDLAAKGSCHIGGNIATNAGGVKFVRYGGMRELVLGLEVVLPSGEVLNMNHSLRKNNTGYDLKHLFIGSEGTLGIITRATMKLNSKPGNLVVSLMATSFFAEVPKILERCNMMRAPITAFEFFTDIAHNVVLDNNPNLKTPFAEKHACYVLLEIDAGKGGDDVIEPILESLFNDGLINDAVVAGTAAQMTEFWSHRENISESIAAAGFAHKNDISIPIDQLGAFIAGLNALIAKEASDLICIVFGHIADGNLHLNYLAPKGTELSLFKDSVKVLEKKVFDLIKAHEGSISAEHGIGLLKKKDLPYSRTASEIEIMRGIKKIFDPQNIMNPGKIFDC